jgi:hypothetical protein
LSFSRREFVKTSVLGAVAAGIGTQAVAEDAGSGARKRPIIVSANNGYAYLEGAFAFLKSGGDTGHVGRPFAWKAPPANKTYAPATNPNCNSISPMIPPDRVLNSIPAARDHLRKSPHSTTSATSPPCSASAPRAKCARFPPPRLAHRLERRRA